MNTKNLDQKILTEHGTRYLTLPPGAIVGAALSDLAVFRKSKPKSRPKLAFPRYHVERSKTAHELLRYTMLDGGHLLKDAGVWLSYDELLKAAEVAKERGV